MRKILLSVVSVVMCNCLSAQNINDNKVSFSYIQLPLIKIDDAFTKYEVRVLHAYLDANKDSIALHEQRKTEAQEKFNQSLLTHQNTCAAIKRSYLTQLAKWETQYNAGATTAAGSPISRPSKPNYPPPPAYPVVKPPRLHKEYAEEVVKREVKIEGFESGLGGSVLSITILPIRNIRIVKTKKGSGAATKYRYKCEYVLPVEIKLETPTQGPVLERVLLQDKKTYAMKEYKSQYEFEIYMLDNEQQFYDALEVYARKNAINEVNRFINDQVGYVDKKRKTEIYSVKKFKNYDYSDVTNAYSATVQALSLVGNERDRSSAQDKLEAALKKWEEIMLESNTYDKKARINDKVSAMIQCNIAEIQIWQSKFNVANATINLALNSGVLKAKNHAKRMKSYYSSLEQRWGVNY